MALSVIAEATSPEDIVTRGALNCRAQWNELCEDKKIISVPEHYRLCHYTFKVTEQSGATRYQVVGQDQSSITVYFSAKGNQDRFKQQAASLSLAVDLSGVKDTETCSVTPDAPPATPAVATPAPVVTSVVTPVAIPVLNPPPAAAVTAPPVSTEIDSTTGDNAGHHACACSQWLNWMKVEHCLTKGPGKEGPPCDSYNVVIQCVSSRDECRALQKESCPQVVGLNQSTSMKRLFVTNSPVCQ